MTRDLLSASLAVLLPFAARAAEPSRPYDYREQTLANGMRVVTLEDWTCPIAAVQVWYHVGSKDENPERQGFAHMFEHMMFRGTDRLGPRDHFDLIQKTGGDCNAYTSFDNTTYINVVPANQLELVLWLEAERLVALKIDEQGFETERRVVEEERRLGLNQPYGSVPEKLLALLFKKHPYRWSVIGQIPHLRAATADELQAFWDRYYVPQNAVLVITGAIRHAEAQELAARYFGWIPRCPDPPRVTEAEPAQAEAVQATIDEENGPVPVTGMAFRTVPKGHRDGPALDVLANIFGQGDSSRLHRQLVRKRVAMVAMAEAFQLEQAGFVGAGAVVSPFGDPQKAQAAIEEEVRKLREEDVSAAEIEKARNALLKERVTTLLSIESKARLLGEAACILGDAEEANREIDRYRAVTAADIRRVAREYLTPERKTAVFIRPTLLGMLKTFLGGAGKGPPEDEGAAPPAPEALAGVRARSTGPKATAVRPAALPGKPPIQAPLREFPRAATAVKTLANGLKVVVIPNREVPLVTLRLALRHGAVHEDAARPGAAAMACAMLTKGTARHTADELAQELERHAIDIGGFASHDDAAVTATALSDQFERAAEYLAEVVRSPTFPPDELDTYREQVRAGLLVDEQEPGYQADREFDRAVYGEHPYSRPAGGTLADVNRLAAADLAKWWGTFARPDAAVLYVAGDVEEARAFAAVESGFGEWKSPASPLPPFKATSFPTASPLRIRLIDRPGSYQSQIRVGHLGVSRRHPEIAGIDVLDQVFGGAFGARLNAALRVKKGLTYGIRGAFSPRKEGGAYRIRTFSKTPATAEAVRTILEELERLQKEPPTAEELDVARGYLTGSFARDRETPQAVAGDLWAIESNSLSADYFEKYLEAAAKATPEDTARLARSLIQPGSMTIVVVGEAARIRADLEKIAPVTVVGGKPAAAGEGGTKTEGR
jgi:zinc protease